MKDPYSILGISPDASSDELKVRYEELKAKYSEGRFAAGEEGNEAAKKLTELEQAWQDIQAKTVVAEETHGGGDYDYIDKLIKDHRYDEAQTVLDSINDRDGQWHYYQSIVYYKREWLTESKRQLEEAIACDPGNEKYRRALEKLKIVMGNADSDPRKMGRDTINDGQMNGDDMQRQADTLSNCCLAYCVTSMCCDAMRCCM